MGITAGPAATSGSRELRRNEIGEINPTTDAISEFISDALHRTIDGRTSTPGYHGRPDGNLWFTAGTSTAADDIGEINPTTGPSASFPLPSKDRQSGITAGPDGNVWFTGNGNVVG